MNFKELIYQKACPHCSVTYSPKTQLKKVPVFDSGEEIQVLCRSCGETSEFSLEKKGLIFNDPSLVCENCHYQNRNYNENFGCCFICGHVLKAYYEKHKFNYDETNGMNSCFISRLEKESPEKAEILKSSFEGLNIQR